MRESGGVVIDARRGKNRSKETRCHKEKTPRVGEGGKSPYYRPILGKKGEIYLQQLLRKKWRSPGLPLGKRTFSSRPCSGSVPLKGGRGGLSRGKKRSAGVLYRGKKGKGRLCVKDRKKDLH